MAQLQRRVSVFVAFPLILTLGACASMGSPSIEQVQSNPGRYANRTVTLNGTVTTAWGLPLVPYRSIGSATATRKSSCCRTEPARRAAALASGFVARFRNSRPSAAGRLASTSAKRASRCSKGFRLQALGFGPARAGGRRVPRRPALPLHCTCRCTCRTPRALAAPRRLPHIAPVRTYPHLPAPARTRVDLVHI